MDLALKALLRAKSAAPADALLKLRVFIGYEGTEHLRAGAQKYRGSRAFKAAYADFERLLDVPPRPVEQQLSEPPQAQAAAVI